MDISNLKPQEYIQPKTENIKEEFVSFEVAKLLKDKGFNERTEFLYEDGKTHLIESYVTNSELLPECYSAPTQQMALRWLREIHKILIYVDFNGEINHYCWAVTDLGNGAPRPYDGLAMTYEEAYNDAIKSCLTNII